MLLTAIFWIKLIKSINDFSGCSVFEFADLVYLSLENLKWFFNCYFIYICTNTWDKMIIYIFNSYQLCPVA